MVHHRSSILLTVAVCTSFIAAQEKARPVVTKWAEIRVVDEASGLRVPLVELETVNGLRFVTDNAGRVAFQEPELMRREVFFHVRSHGYERTKDGFGYAGATVRLKAGEVTEIKVKRTMLAERMCRLTGEGLFRDSELLGYEASFKRSANRGIVAGQDSIQAAIYQGKVFCLWGDTMRMNYPLGLYRTAGGTFAIPDPADPELIPVDGIPYDYFVDKKTGFTRAMMPLASRPEGVIWIFGLFTVPDKVGKERLVGHYSRRKGLDGELEHGIAVYNDEKQIFEPAREFPLSEKWRRPNGHPITYVDGGIKWLLAGCPNPNVRVPATLQDVLDETKWEAFTCAKADKPDEPDLDEQDKPRWRWQKELPPTDSKTEHAWIRAKKLEQKHARYCPVEASSKDNSSPEDAIVLHSGSVRWNDYCQRYVLIAGQIEGKSSHLGEVWYAEALAPTGPFSSAVKIATHNQQTFYNVCHHSFLDRGKGRTIFFEGTYTNDFSGNSDKTPRYNYNQVLYRLDLGVEALLKVRE